MKMLLLICLLATLIVQWNRFTPTQAAQDLGIDLERQILHQDSSNISSRSNISAWCSVSPYCPRHCSARFASNTRTASRLGNDRLYFTHVQHFFAEIRLIFRQQVMSWYIMWFLRLRQNQAHGLLKTCSTS